MSSTEGRCGAKSVALERMKLSLMFTPSRTMFVDEVLCPFIDVPCEGFDAVPAAVRISASGLRVRRGNSNN